MAAGGLSNKGQIWSLPKNTGHQPINKAGHHEQKKPGIGPSREFQPDPRPPWSNYPLQQHREHQQHVENKRLQRIEPGVAAETRVPDDAEVEAEEGDEAGVGHGVIEREERDERLERSRQNWVLGEQEPPVLEAVEEGDEVRRRGD